MALGEQEADPSAFAITCPGMWQEPFLFAIILTLTLLAPPVMLISKQIKLHRGSTLCESPPPTPRPIPETKTGLLSIQFIIFYFTLGVFQAVILITRSFLLPGS